MAPAPVTSVRLRKGYPSHYKHTHRAAVYSRPGYLRRGLSGQLSQDGVVHGAQFRMLADDGRVRTVAKYHARTLGAGLPVGVIIHLVELFDGEIEPLCQRLSGSSSRARESSGQQLDTELLTC